mmetsp:Transcript_7429/g.20633  ORF Transcript_7429/g.20633 Transcript_7429/m.20633 type:complete len:1161 (+) Transcript_7429:327-3809(+)
MAEPTVETENGWAGRMEDERKPAAAAAAVAVGPNPNSNASSSPRQFANDQHMGDTEDEGQDTLDVRDMTLLTQQEASDRGDGYYSTDDGYHDGDDQQHQHQHQYQHQLLTQEAATDADAGDYHDDEMGSISDGFIPMNDDDVSSSDGEDGSGGHDSGSGSSSSDGSDEEDDDGDDDDSSSSSASSDSDESATRLEKDLRDVDTTSSPAGGTPRIVRNRRRAIARNKERLRLLMEGVERPGAPAGAAAAENGDAAGTAMHRSKKKRRSGRTSRKFKSPGKGRGAKTGKRRGMLFPTRYNAVEPAASSGIRGSATAAASPIGLSQRHSTDGSVSALATQQQYQQQTYTSIAEEVGNRFPHREPQIRLLSSVFERTMRQTGSAAGGNDSSSGRATTDHDVTTASDGSFVPSPVFVTGPSGAGKTSVVRDILQCLKRRHADTAAPVILSPSCQQRQEQKPSIARAGGVGMGYINCSSMEGSSAGAFLEEAYKQILRSFFASSSRKPSRRSRKRKRHGASPKRQVNGGADTGGAINGHASAPDPKSTEVGSTKQSDKGGTLALEKQQQSKSPATDNGNGKHISISPAKAPASRHISVDDEEVDPMIDHDDGEEGFGDIEDQIEQAKKDHLRTKIVTQQSDGLGGGGGAKPGDSTLSTRRQHTINTPADFGRALLPLCGGPDDLVSKSRYCGCAFLVLDHADRLLSMTAKQNSPYNTISKDERNNLLSQLLLLPRVMGLNLTIVVLTANSLLEFGRTNNVHMQPSSSLGTIQDAIHPVRVRFHAYRGKQIYRSILLLPSIKNVVIGSTGTSSMKSRGMCPGSQKIMTIARDRLYNAMIKTILQSLEGMTRDIREIQRFARIFWPIYISPLTTGHAQDPSGVIKKKFCLALARSGTFQTRDGHDDAAASTLCQQETCCFCQAVSSLNTSSGGKIDSILEMLDIKGRKPMREIMSKCLFAPVQKLDTTAYPESHPDATYLRSLRNLQGSSLAQLSYMAKFLLLSAYLCQKNRQEQDLALFTNHNKGRRRKTSSEGNNAGDGEGALFASSAAAQQQLRSFRLTGFPLERMISVFSSILSKYGSESELLKDTTQEDGYLNVTGVGSTQLFGCLAELRDFGLLCDMNGGLSAGGEIDMAAKKYTCNLSDADATGLSQELEIPLQKYLLQER